MPILPLLHTIAASRATPAPRNDRIIPARNDIETLIQKILKRFFVIPAKAGIGLGSVSEANHITTKFIALMFNRPYSRSGLRRNDKLMELLRNFLFNLRGNDNFSFGKIVKVLLYIVIAINRLSLRGADASRRRGNLVRQGNANTIRAGQDCFVASLLAMTTSYSQ
jgi:hypothetical protein